MAEEKILFSPNLLAMPLTTLRGVSLFLAWHYRYSSAGPALISQRFEFCNSLNVLGPARCSLEMDQSLQIYETAFKSEEISNLGTGQERIVGPSTSRFAKDVEISGVRC